MYPDLFLALQPKAAGLAHVKVSGLELLAPVWEKLGASGNVIYTLESFRSPILVTEGLIKQHVFIYGVILSRKLFRKLPDLVFLLDLTL